MVFAAFSAAHAGIQPEAGQHYAIYLLAGQSNMDGRGKANDLTGDLAGYAAPHDQVLIRYSSGGHHRRLRESEGLIVLQPGCNEQPGQFGPELGFGHTMAAARPDQRLIFIKVSEGGTNLREDWNPDHANSLYQRLVGIVGETRDLLAEHDATFEIAGMIWHQGESDSADPHVAQYADRLTGFVGRIRADLELPDLPFVIGELCADNPRYETVIAAQKEVAASVPGVGFASSAGLTTHDEDVHFDFGSLIELGRRFAHAMLALEGKPAASTPPTHTLHHR